MPHPSRNLGRVELPIFFRHCELRCNAIQPEDLSASGAPAVPACLPEAGSKGKPHSAIGVEGWPTRQNQQVRHHRLVPVFRHSLRQFFEGAVEKASCHYQTANGV